MRGLDRRRQTVRVPRALRHSRTAAPALLRSAAHSASPNNPTAASLSSIAIHWRASFDAAENALRAATRCRRSIGFPPGELESRTAQLLLERRELSTLLDAIAREEHATIRHPLSAPASDRFDGRPTGLVRKPAVSTWTAFSRPVRTSTLQFGAKRSMHFSSESDPSDSAISPRFCTSISARTTTG